MFSSLSSYIWSSGSEDQTVPDISDEMLQQRGEDEWILVDFVKEKPNVNLDEIDAIESKQRPVAKSLRPNVENLEESWYVTPPSCFNASQGDELSLQTSPLENLLIEHPSMSVYGGANEPWVDLKEESLQASGENQDHSTDETAVEPRPHAHRRSLRTVNKPEELTRRVQKNVLEKTNKQNKKKTLQKHNQTHVRSARSRRKQKKLDRKQGKPSTVYSNRGC